MDVVIGRDAGVEWMGIVFKPAPRRVARARVPSSHMQFGLFRFPERGRRLALDCLLDCSWYQAPRRSASQVPEQSPPCQEPEPIVPDSRPEPVALLLPALTVTV